MKIIQNKTQNRFETEAGGELAYLDYELYNGNIALTYTFVPPQARHQGIAFALVKFALDFAKDEGLKVIPACSSVTVFIEQNPEYESLLK